MTKSLMGVTGIGMILTLVGTLDSPLRAQTPRISLCDAPAVLPRDTVLSNYSPALCFEYSDLQPQVYTLKAWLLETQTGSFFCGSCPAGPPTECARSHCFPPRFAAPDSRHQNRSLFLPRWRWASGPARRHGATECGDLLAPLSLQGSAPDDHQCSGAGDVWRIVPDRNAECGEHHSGELDPPLFGDACLQSEPAHPSAELLSHGQRPHGHRPRQRESMPAGALPPFHPEQ